jgi:Uma2 family endonuclease
LVPVRSGVKLLAPARVYDREFKRDAYFALGVQQVWLVDWWDRWVEVGRAPGKTRRVRDVIKWRIPRVDVAVTLDLSEIFAGV